MAKYRKKPVVIDAIRITRPMTVKTLEGVMQGSPGDWLITGVKGEQYFCKDDIFRITYEMLSENIKENFWKAEDDSHNDHED